MPLSEATSLSLSDTCFDCGSGSSSVIRSQHSLVRMEVKSHLSEVEALCPVLQCKMWTVKERTPPRQKAVTPRSGLVTRPPFALGPGGHTG